MQDPRISIITPVFNMLPYLKQCIHSVSDQNILHEHIIVDGGSTDGTKDLLQESVGLRWVSEKDKGMYNALNKGLIMANSQIIGHLNADEQYLPGTLSYVIDYFEKHPHIDYVVADFLLINNNGELIACRKSFQPFWPFFFSNYLYTFTCTLFYRRRVVESLKYNEKLKSIADVDFVYKIQKMGFKGAHIRKFVSAFTYTGDNLSSKPISNIERQEYEKNNLPSWFKLVKPILKLAFYVARLISGTLLHRETIQYELYTPKSGFRRAKFVVKNPSSRWKKFSV